MDLFAGGTGVAFKGCAVVEMRKSGHAVASMSMAVTAAKIRNDRQELGKRHGLLLSKRAKFMLTPHFVRGRLRRSTLRQAGRHDSSCAPSCGCGRAKLAPRCE